MFDQLTNGGTSRPLAAGNLNILNNFFEYSKRKDEFADSFERRIAGAASFGVGFDDPVAPVAAADRRGADVVFGVDVDDAQHADPPDAPGPGPAEGKRRRDACGGCGFSVLPALPVAGIEASCALRRGLILLSFISKRPVTLEPENVSHLHISLFL